MQQYREQHKSGKDTFFWQQPVAQNSIVLLSAQQICAGYPVQTLLGCFYSPTC